MVHGLLTSASTILTCFACLLQEENASLHQQLAAVPEAPPAAAAKGGGSADGRGDGGGKAASGGGGGAPAAARERRRQSPIGWSSLSVGQSWWRCGRRTPTYALRTSSSAARTRRCAMDACMVGWIDVDVCMHAWIGDS